MKSILSVIEERLPTMSPGYSQLAKYILQHSRKIASLDISSLASESGVSTATITRFANSLGCDGFPGLKRELAKHSYNYYTSTDEIASFIQRSDPAITNVEDTLSTLSANYQNIDKNRIIQAAELIVRSRQILVCGNQISNLFIQYTKYLLGKYAQPIIDVSALSLENARRIENAGAQDCAIDFALQRYPTATMHIIRMLHAAKVPMIIVTDSDLFPLRDLAHTICYVPFKDPLAFGPVMLVYSAIYDITLHVVALDPDRAKKNVQKFDEFVDQNNIYMRFPDAGASLNPEG